MASNFCQAASKKQEPDSGTLPTESAEPCMCLNNECTNESTNVAKLLTARKSEQMFELRKLKLQQRPVSGFENAQHLEKIMICKSGKSKQHAENEPNSSVSSRAQELSNRDTNPEPQNLRPVGVQLEIRALFERRPVSQVLQSPMLDEMEHALQEGLNRHQRSHRRRRPRASNHHHGRSGGERSLLAAIRNSERSRSSGSRLRRRVPFQPPSDGQYPLPRRDQSNIVQQLRQSPALNSLGDEDRDRIVSEVSNLVQQQLVTSALSGEFRGVLELHIQERANHVSQGQTGEDFVQSLRRHNERNPVQSASNSELHQEVKDMKAQLSELKQMLKASFDLQLDIQRSIRQEVAAALTAFLSPPAQQATHSAQPAAHTCPIPTLAEQVVGGSGPGTNQSSGSQLRVVESGHCVICSEGIIDSVIYHCGHMCVCMSCGLQLRSQNLKCPLCRAPITDVIRAYASML